MTPGLIDLHTHVPLRGVTVQNEPLATQRWDGLWAGLSLPPHSIATAVRPAATRSS